MSGHGSGIVIDWHGIALRVYCDYYSDDDGCDIYNIAVLDANGNEIDEITDHVKYDDDDFQDNLVWHINRLIETNKIDSRL